MTIKGREDYFLLQSIPSPAKLSWEKKNAPSSAEAVKAAAVDNLFSLFTQSGVLCVAHVLHEECCTKWSNKSLQHARQA